MVTKITRAELARLIAILEAQLEQMGTGPEEDEDGVTPGEGAPEPEASLMEMSVSQTAAVIPVLLSTCSQCGSSLRTVDQHVQECSYMVDTLPIELVVMEIKRYGCTCPSCGSEQVAGYPNGLEPDRFFGKRLEALTDYIRSVWNEGRNSLAGSPVDY
jgi:hypothetical protein